MKKDKSSGGLLAAVFALFISTAFLLLLFSPKQDFSESENRYLAKFPEVTASAVARGEFGTDFEKYLSDNFPFRNSLVALRSHTLLSAGSRSINQIYVGDDRLFEAFENPDMTLLQRQTEAVNTFIERADAPVYFAVAPTSACVNSELMPANMCSSQEEYIAEFYNRLNCRTIDLTERLKSFRNEYIYYRTDHHWTTLGAFYAYEKLCEDLRVYSAKITDYKIKSVSDSFLGTLYSKVLLEVTPDEIYMLEGKTRVLLEYNNGATVDSFYFDEFLSEKDKYSYFLGGNPPFLKVTSDGKTDKSLVVICDSYAHCMAPFLSATYKTVYYLDPRYLNENLTELVNGLKPSEILILYNAKTLSEEKNILKMGY